MRKLTPPTVIVSALSLLLTAPGHGSSETPSDSIPVLLTAPAPRFDSLPDDPRPVATMAGFGSSAGVGQPDLPVRIVLIAIPDAGTPRLRIRHAPYETLTGLDLAPVPAVRVPERIEGATGVFALDRNTHGGSADPAGPLQHFRRDYAASPAIDLADRFDPIAPARLGSIGYLRQQRFVEVVYTPIAYSPGRREARLYREVRAEVMVDGATAGQGSGPFRADPYFEDLYERTLINYEQGREFRSRRGAAQATAVDDVTAAAATTPQMIAGSPRYKIKVSRSGIYRLDHAYFNANAPGILALDPGTWFLQTEGVEMPIAIRDLMTGGPGDGDGVFGATDVLEFYGRAKDDEAPAVLNYDFPASPNDIYLANDYTDVQVYWLCAAAPSGSHLRIPSVSGTPGAPGFALAGHFEATARWEENEVFIPLGAEEPFFSLPSLLADSVAQQRDIAIPLPGIAAVTATGNLTVRLRGGTSLAANPDHRTRIWVNSDTIGGIDFTWDGEVIHQASLPVDQAVLTDPVTIHVLADLLGGVGTDRQYLDRMTLTYRRTFQAAGGSLVFSYPNQDVRFAVGGLTSAAPVILEIGRDLPGSSQSDPVRITGAIPSGMPTATYTFEVPQDTSPGAPAARTFIVAAPSALVIPDEMTLAADPVLQVPGIAADMVVIGARDLIAVSPGQESLDALLAHRLATQGLTSRIVFIDQVYDEFSEGRRDPNAIRSFLDYAFDNWTGPGGTDPPPSFVLLVGDGTPDYKNTLNRPDWVDQVPTPIMYQRNSILGYHSSDNYLAAFRGGDQIPDAHIGRISTRTSAAAATAFDKIRMYETAPPPGSWKGRAVLTAGDGKSGGEADQFEAINDDAAATYFSSAPFSHPTPPLYFAEPPWNGSDQAGFNTALIGEFEGGAGIATYIGHGNFDTWGLQTLMTTEDAEALTNGLELPFMMNVNCLAGGFHFLVGSGALGEGMVNNPDGGAIAVLAPSGLSNTFIGTVITDEVLAALFGPRQERILGPATASVRGVLWSQNAIGDLQSFTFLGDPATVLAIPAPSPPADLSAVGGNGEVTLSWVAPLQPVAGIRIYRAATIPTAPYSAVACSPLSSTSCVDQTVSNATRYYYYAVAFDAEGYEGPATNLNSDCDGGPDCVTALPLNPGPPSKPTGLSATDLGSGGALSLSWIQNPESDIDFYTVYYGVMSENYSASATTSGTSQVLLGLADNTRYYMVLTATNTSGHESLVSDEVSAVPHLIQGIAPPRTISDLTLSMSGGDIELSWSRPQEDIYGRPTVVVGYRVYRDDSPGFQPSQQSLIGTIGDGALTDFSDVGAALDPTSAYYLVTAIDAFGFASGAGGALPAGVADLQVERLAGDMMRLSWSGITTNTDGMPTLIDHYQVHASVTPLGRADLGPATLVLDNVTSGQVDLPLPGGLYYTSVLAVDNRGNLSPF